MPVAYDVLIFYGAIAVWATLLVRSLRTKRFWPFLLFGLAIMLVLNIGYFVKGQPDAIAFFIGIYDVFDNLGLGRTEGAPALAQCADNACTVWGERYVNHPSWGVAFYERFASGDALRRNLLYAHIGFNTIAFVLMHYQLWKPGTGDNRERHRLLGKISFASVTLGTFFAVWLASQHDAVGEYGGIWAEIGFYSMSIVVYGAVLMSVIAARQGLLREHRIWSIRAVGAMWGAFWLFRVMLVVTGPLLRSYESASILLSIWLSAPLGLLIAEAFRRRSPTIDVTSSGTRQVSASTLG